MIKWNLNNTVRVSLTTEGEKLLMAWHLKNVASMIEFSLPAARAMKCLEPGEDGFYYFQMHTFMEIFGGMNSMALEKYLNSFYVELAR